MVFSLKHAGSQLKGAEKKWAKEVTGGRKRWTARNKQTSVRCVFRRKGRDLDMKIPGVLNYIPSTETKPVLGYYMLISSYWAGWTIIIWFTSSWTSHHCTNSSLRVLTATELGTLPPCLPKGLSNEVSHYCAQGPRSYDKCVSENRESLKMVGFLPWMVI